MNSETLFTPRRIGLVIGATLLATLTGCVTEGSYHSRGYRSGAEVQVQAGVVFEDDYDYYPGYETYYSRSRREFVYRDGRSWVRRSEPRGISVDLLLAAPSVRMEFRDAPERHHRQVVKTYPKRWTPPAQAHDNRGDRRDDRKEDRKDDRRRN
jgi:hypothetical protein